MIGMAVCLRVLRVVQNAARWLIDLFIETVGRFRKTI